MNFRLRFPASAWMLILFCAGGWLVWTDWMRGQHVVYATGLAQEERKLDALSPTGFAGGTRELIVPEHNNDSYHWIAQAQQMFAQGVWRVRHIDYENAPFGRAVNSASPYRWWLGLLGWIDHAVSSRSLGLSVEHAALFADPLLHLLLLLGTAIFVARRFGSLPAMLVSLGLVLLFPLAGSFLPGAPDQQGLALSCSLWSVLVLLAGIGLPSPAGFAAGGKPTELKPADDRTQTRRWFFAAGLIGGLGLWIDVAYQVPILVGVGLGAICAAWVGRARLREKPAETPPVLPWRAWSLGGAVASLGAYLIEYYPAHLGSWELRVIHPLYGLAWLGMGEVLAQAVAWIQREKPPSKLRAAGLAALGIVAVAAIPVAMRLTSSPGFLAAEPPSLRLTKLPDGIVALNFYAWLVRDGLSGKVWAVFLPVLLIGPAIWLLVSRKTGFVARTRLALALGPVLIALGFACWQLTWWNPLDALLLLLVLATALAMQGADIPRFARRVWIVFMIVVLVPGAIQLVPPVRSAAAKVLTQLEVQGLIERDMFTWLAKRTGGSRAVVLATPNQTTTLAYYGGLRGLGTLSWENREGFGAALRLASATSVEEAFELISRREIAYLVIPSWDPQLDEYARMGLGQLEGSFIDQLNHWVLPPWLQPMAYQLPAIAGLEGQSVMILKVVEDQNSAVALSRIAEYLVEMGQLDKAAVAGQALRRFPTDLGALVARAHVEIARDDLPGFARTVELLLPRLSDAQKRSLPWDRRVSLAVVLARAKKTDLARVQTQRCLAEVDEANLRSLSTGQLYRLQVLGKAFDMKIADPRLRALALELLPPEIRSRL